MQTKQTDLARLLTGTKVFVVPQFQRHYKWKIAQWTELWEDVIEQYDSEDVKAGFLTKNDGHFLGSIVLHPAPGPASTVSRYWVIDGQQRLTTLLALIAALRDVRSAAELDWDPDTYTKQYLANPYNRDEFYRLVPGDDDREDFVSTVYEQRPAGQIGGAYEWFVEQLEERLKLTSIDFNRLQNALFLRLILVEINTSEDDSINQIFNTINHSGMRLSAIDLIRNHTFMQFAAGEAEQVHAELWKPLEIVLGEAGLAQYLWAQLVRRDPKATQRDLYGPFQALLTRSAKESHSSSSDATRDELVRLNAEMDLFKYVTGSSEERPADVSEDIHRVIAELQCWGSQTYVPMALEVLSRLRENRVTSSDALRALHVMLAYLVRRGLAGIPSNNLNRILSALPYAVMRADVIADAVIKELLSSGKYWPRDRELVERGVSNPIYSTLQRGQVAYVLAKLNESLDGGDLAAGVGGVRRVMPAPLTDGWRYLLSDQDVPVEVAEARTEVIGNLAYELSESTQIDDPALASSLLNRSVEPVNSFAIEATFWLPDLIDRRSEELLMLATRIWPIPESGFVLEERPDDAPTGLTVRLVLDAIPADSFVAVSDIATLLAVSADTVESESQAANYPVLKAPGGRSVVGGFRDMTEVDTQNVTELSKEELLGYAQAMGSEGPFEDA